MPAAITNTHLLTKVINAGKVSRDHKLFQVSDAKKLVIDLFFTEFTNTDSRNKTGFFQECTGVSQPIRVEIPYLS